MPDEGLYRGPDTRNSLCLKFVGQVWNPKYQKMLAKERIFTKPMEFDKNGRAIGTQIIPWPDLHMVGQRPFFILASYELPGGFQRLFQGPRYRRRPATLSTPLQMTRPIPANSHWGRPLKASTVNP